MRFIDVYKRQAITKFMYWIKNNFDKETITELSSIAVSYTHLDVYKRQIYISALDAVSVSCLTTPDSRKRFPSINIPTNGAVVGRITHTTIVTMIGNRILSSLDTGLNCSISVSYTHLSYLKLRTHHPDLHY